MEPLRILLAGLLLATTLSGGCSPPVEDIEVEVPGCESVTECADDDLCCPAGCQALEDNDCLPVCGNGVTEEGEVCDGDCPVECDDGVACTADSLEGLASECTASCRYAEVTACQAGDGCCPGGCNQLTDPDCSATCGNGFIEAGESCDGDCPSDCNDFNACTLDRLAGSAANCSASCYHQRIDVCLSGDGCCPPGCTSLSDGDCLPRCGNGVIEPGESCDGNCPEACDDEDPCTADSLSGSPENCDAVCVQVPIGECLDGDGCCPEGCNLFGDDDCPGCPEGEYPCPGGCCPWRVRVVEQGCYRHSHLEFDSQDRPALVCQLPNAAFRLALSTPAGFSIRSLGAGQYHGYRPVLTFDAGDHLRVAFVDRDDNRLVMARESFLGWEFMPVGVLSEPQGLHRPMDLEAGPSGEIQLSFDRAQGGSLVHARGLGEEWDLSVVDAGSESIAWKQDLAVDPAGNPHLCYINHDDRELWYADWDGSGWRTERITDGAGGCAIDTDDQGAPHLAYTRNHRGLLLAVDRGAGFETHAYRKDAGFRLYGVAVDSRGRAHIGFWEDRPGEGSWQMYARFNGTRLVVLTVDRIHETLSGCGAIAVDSDDRPAVSWFENRPGGQSPGRTTMLADWR